MLAIGSGSRPHVEELFRLRDIVLIDRKPIVDRYNVFAAVPEHEVDEVCYPGTFEDVFDYNAYRRRWWQRIVLFVHQARKWFHEELIEELHLLAYVHSIQRMEKTWNATRYIDDDNDYELDSFPKYDDLLLLTDSTPSIHAGAGANAVDIFPSPAPIDLSTQSGKSTKTASPSSSLSSISAMGERVKDIAGVEETSPIPAPIDLSTRSGKSTKTESPLLSSSPISAMGEKIKDVANVEEISPIPAPIDLSTRNGKSTKTTPLLDIAAAHEQLMIEKQTAEELESVRKENEALRLRLQEVEAAVDARIKEVERKKEEEFSKRVDVYVTEIKKERKKCESLRQEVASLKEELTAAKAESEQKRLPRQQAAKKLDKNEKATTHGATASKKKGKKQCGDDSFCAVKADKGFRHATRQLFQSRLVQVSECFFRKNDASSDGRVFDFDDFLNEIQGWLSILRAKNVNDKDDAKTQLHFPASSRETTSLQEEISHVLTPATTPTNYSSESLVLPLAADELEPST